MLCYHPHGILCTGYAWNGAHSRELAHRFTWLVVDVLLLAPVFGWVLHWKGNFAGASAASMQRLMSAGSNVALTPGGFEEATLQQYVCFPLDVCQLLVLGLTCNF